MAHRDHSSRARVCPLLGRSGHRAALARDALVANDSSATSSSTSCCSSEVGFGPFQSPDLTRYDASS